MRQVFDDQGFSDVHIIEVQNSFFGGNTAVAGLMTFEDIHCSLSLDGGRHQYLLPDVCLNDGMFLDGGTLEALRRDFAVEVLTTSGSSLRERLESAKREVSHV